MSNGTTADLRQPAQTEAFFDFVQMLSGVALILFMWAHMILVASVNLGAGTMNAIAAFFERTYMAQVGSPIIVLIFFAHFLLTARKMPFRIREQRTMWRHSLTLNHFDTWLWVIQVTTAMIILILGSIHMWTVLTDLPISAAKSAGRIQGGWWVASYAILLPMIELHIGIGFYRIGVKWGWITRSNRSYFKRFENRMTLAFIIIGVITLLNFYFIVQI